MRKSIIIVAMALGIMSYAFFFATAFINHKCDHVFTEVVQPLVKIDYSDRWVNAVYTIGPTGRHEGNELVCVKCFHKQKQIVDYGQPYKSHNEELKMPDWWRGATLVTDTIDMRTLTIRGDTLVWSTVK